ncbi:MAG: hypothetical protein IJE65_05035 [Clostridia bacterium]|nr:hypothetical protein [Clostridia bacterium]
MELLLNPQFIKNRQCPFLSSEKHFTQKGKKEALNKKVQRRAGASSGT